MAENGREKPFGIGAGQGEFIGMTDAGRLDFDQHFAGARTLKLHGGDFKRFAWPEGDGSTNIDTIGPWF
jgi:hypothetical protein